MLFFFVFVVVSVFGAFLDEYGFLVVGGDVSGDGAGVLVDAVGPFVEVFAANLSPSHQERLIVFHFLFQSDVNYVSKD